MAEAELNLIRYLVTPDAKRSVPPFSESRSTMATLEHPRGLYSSASPQALGMANVLKLPDAAVVGGKGSSAGAPRCASEQHFLRLDGLAASPKAD